MKGIGVRLMAISLTQYTRVDGIPTLRDSEIYSIWHRMKAEGSLRWVNFEGDIDTAELFYHALDKAFACFIVHYNSQLSGILWLNRYHHGRAQLHFCSFKNVWGYLALGIGKYTIDRLFGIKHPVTGEPILHALLAVVPVNNRLVLKFAAGCGFKRTGKIEDYFFEKTTQSRVAGIHLHLARSDRP